MADKFDYSMYNPESPSSFETPSEFLKQVWRNMGDNATEFSIINFLYHVWKVPLSETVVVRQWNFICPECLYIMTDFNVDDAMKNAFKNYKETFIKNDEQ